MTFAQTDERAPRFARAPHGWGLGAHRELEAAIARHPAVYHVVVTDRPSTRWGNAVVALVQLADGQRVDSDSIIAEAAHHLARYKLPKAIVSCGRVQRSPSGNADYRWAKAQVPQSI